MSLPIAEIMTFLDLWYDISRVRMSVSGHFRERGKVKLDSKALPVSDHFYCKFSLLRVSIASSSAARPLDSSLNEPVRMDLDGKFSLVDNSMFGSMKRQFL